MKTNEISKNNKLIAGFMGIFPTGNNWYDGRELKKAGLPFSLGLMGNGTNELKFHSSWDRLMPVVKKIYSMNEYYTYKEKESGQFEVAVVLSTNITHVYDSVVEFITWYNENKENT